MSVCVCAVSRAGPLCVLLDNSRANLDGEGETPISADFCKQE